VSPPFPSSLLTNATCPNFSGAQQWPIYEKKEGGAVMYYMIHATDHPLAPGLMARAYKKAVYPREPVEQLQMELGIE
jgi:hypothetical protein